MTTIVYGKKYDQAFSTVDIAKRVRSDIKAAITSGELPKGLKTSVRCDGSSMHSSIDVRVTACPGLQITSPEYGDAGFHWQLENADRDAAVAEYHTARAAAAAAVLSTDAANDATSDDADAFVPGVFPVALYR